MCLSSVSWVCDLEGILTYVASMLLDCYFCPSWLESAHCKINHINKNMRVRKLQTSYHLYMLVCICVYKMTCWASMYCSCTKGGSVPTYCWPWMCFFTICTQGYCAWNYKGNSTPSPLFFFNGFIGAIWGSSG